MKTRAFAAGLGALSILGAGASAADITGIGGVGYTNSTGGVNGYEAAGAAMFPVYGNNLKAEVGASYERAAYNGVSIDIENVTADIFWKDKAGEIGASLGYHRLSAGVELWGYTISGDASVTSYGAFGEWYANRWLSVRVKGGAYSGDADGGYAGAGFGVYFGRDLVWNNGYDYLSMNGLGHMSIISTGPEFLPYQSLPLSIGLHYSRSWYGGSSSAANTFGVALKFRLGADMDLRAWDRAGPTQWNGALPL